MDAAELLHIEYLSKKYNENTVPLYLSYPTTSWWKSRLSQEHYIQAYNPTSTPLLYFHFPYCSKACHYCCCYKQIATNQTQIENYLKYLETEFFHTLDSLGIDTINNLKHMHWGGGTPTYLSCDQLKRMFASISKKVAFDTADDCSFSIEAYPNSSLLAQDTITCLKRLGFNEISFGIQDFDPRIQTSINRDCSIDIVRTLIEQAHTQGLRVHIDLCYGLPFQGLNELEKTINAISVMKPDRIALFSYAHHPLIFPGQRNIPKSSIPSSFIKVLMAQLGSQLLESYGYKKIGLDHYVKADDPLHIAAQSNAIIKDFMGYSVDKRKFLLGFGYSAISRMNTAYFHNATMVEEYYKKIDTHTIPLDEHKAHVLSADDLLREAVLLQGILCDFSIDKQKIQKQFSISFDSYFNSELENLKEYQQDGLITPVDTNTISITDTGKLFAKHIAYIFDKYYHYS